MIRERQSWVSTKYGNTEKTIVRVFQYFTQCGAFLFLSGVRHVPRFANFGVVGLCLMIHIRIKFKKKQEFAKHKNPFILISKNSTRADLAGVLPNVLLRIYLLILADTKGLLALPFSTKDREGAAG